MERHFAGDSAHGTPDRRGAVFYSGEGAKKLVYLMPYFCNTNMHILNGWYPMAYTQTPVTVRWFTKSATTSMLAACHPPVIYEVLYCCARH